MRSVLVFDLDGTLIDSAPDIRTVLNGVLQDIGRRPLSLAEVTAMIGDGPGKLLERALKASGAAVEGAPLVSLVDRFVQRYAAAAVTETRPYPSVHETLSDLRMAGYRFGICTNKPEAATRAVLSALDLGHWFDSVKGVGSLPGGIQKPDPRLLYAVIEELTATADQTVMIGDAANDVAVARAAGVPAVVRSGGYTAVPAVALGADAVFTDFAELPGLLARLA